MRKTLIYLLAALMGTVLVGFIALVLGGNLLKGLDERAYGWVFVDRSGQRVGQATFDEMRPLSNGLAAVRVGDRWGYADSTGAVVIAPAYQEALEFLVADRAAVMSPENARWGYIDRSGAWVVDPTLHETWGYSQGLAGARVSIGLRTSRISTAISDLSAGILRRDGTWLRAPVEDPHGADRLLRVREASEDRVAVDVQGKWAFLDLDGEVVVPANYDDSRDYSEGTAPVQSEGTWSFIDRDGQTTLAGPYQDALPFHEGLAAVKTGGGWSYVDPRGVVVIPGPFQRARSFSEGYAAVALEDFWGFIDRSGKLVVPATFRSVESDVSEGFAVVTRQMTRLETGHLSMDGQTRWYLGALPYESGVAGARIKRE